MSRRCDLSGKGVQTGNNVSHAHNKTRRRFLPNLQQVSILSVALNSKIRLKVCMHTLRTIDKKGGLDAYVLSTRDDKLTDKAIRLKRRIKKAIESKAA